MRGSELIPTTGADAASGPPNRNGWEPRAAGFDVGGGGIAEKRNHGGNVGGRPRVADVKADAAVNLYIARETPIPDICARLGLAQKWEEFTGTPCATGTLAV